MLSSVTLPQHHAPLLEITPTDHRAWIAIAVALGLASTLTTLVLRGFIRAVINPPFGTDDISFGAAIVSQSTNCVVVHFSE